VFADTFFCVVTGLSMHRVEKAVVSQRVSLVRIVRLVYEYNMVWMLSTEVFDRVTKAFLGTLYIHGR